MHTAMYSSVTLPRDVYWSPMPSAANSSAIHPTPIPRMTRPCEIRSIVDSVLASTTGLRYGTISTLVPIRTRVVRAPIAAITANGS